MAAMNGDTNAPLSAPQNQWEKFRKTTREEYRASFYQELVAYEKAKQPE
jgi:hypothetical protein